jgi:hypothetical protein
MQNNHAGSVRRMKRGRSGGRIETLRVAVALAALCICRAAAAQQPSAEDVNAANNPLTPTITFNVHDLWAPELYDLDPGSNTFLLRGVIPHKLGGRGTAVSLHVADRHGARRAWGNRHGTR